MLVRGPKQRSGRTGRRHLAREGFQGGCIPGCLAGVAPSLRHLQEPLEHVVARPHPVDPAHAAAAGEMLSVGQDRVARCLYATRVQGLQEGTAQIAKVRPHSCDLEALLGDHLRKLGR